MWSLEGHRRGDILTQELRERPGGVSPQRTTCSTWTCALQATACTGHQPHSIYPEGTVEGTCPRDALSMGQAGPVAPAQPRPSSPGLASHRVESGWTSSPALHGALQTLGAGPSSLVSQGVPAALQTCALRLQPWCPTRRSVACVSREEGAAKSRETEGSFRSGVQRGLGCWRCPGQDGQGLCSSLLCAHPPNPPAPPDSFL